LQNAIQKMGNNFLVAAFVPAMAFILIVSIVFQDVLPSFLHFEGEIQSLIRAGIYLLLFTIVLGFTMFSLSTYIYKSFEGYNFILATNTPIRRSFLKRQKKRFRQNDARQRFIGKQLARLEKKINVEGNPRRREQYSSQQKNLYDKRYELAAERSLSLPPSIDLILPSRFGNILRASEMYPWTRYGIDSVLIWGRLIHVIPQEGMEKIDEANNQCLFLLNTSVLATLFSFICLLTSLYYAFYIGTNINILSFLQTISIAPPDTAKVWGYFIWAIFSGLLAWFFYGASLVNVVQFGNMIRAAYDLYRHDLISALHLKSPKSLEQEKKLWRRITYFMAENDAMQEIIDKEQFEELIKKFPELDSNTSPEFKYSYPKDKNKKQPNIL
jgi:hypothetical protein